MKDNKIAAKTTRSICDYARILPEYEHEINRQVQSAIEEAYSQGFHEALRQAANTKRIAAARATPSEELGALRERCRRQGVEVEEQTPQRQQENAALVRVAMERLDARKK